MPSLALACRLSAAQAPQSLPRRVRNILSKYGATMLLPGAAEPVLGPELIQDKQFNDPTKWSFVQPTSGVVSVSDGLARINTSNGSYAAVSPWPAFYLEIGKTYLFEFEIASVTGGGIRCDAGGVVGLAKTTVGIHRGIITAITDTRPVLARANTGVPTDATITHFTFRKILSYNDTVSTFHAGNYIESTSQTLTPVDGAVGLAVDAAGTVGPELVTNGGFDSADGWTLAANGTATAPTISGGVVSFNSQSNDYTYCRRDLPSSLIVGRSYEVVVNCSAFTTGRFQVAFLGGTVQIPISDINAVGVRRFVFVPVSSNTGIEISRNGAGPHVASFTSISIRELPGIHATQPTTQNKPVLRRGLVNLLTYSNDFSNAAWTTKLRVSISGQTLTATESTGNGFLIGRSSATQFGQTTVAILLEKGSRDNCVINLWDGTNGTRRWFNLATVEPGHSASFGSGVTAVQASAVALPDGKRIISFTANIASGTPQLTFYPSVDSATGFGCTAGEFGIVHAVATFQGTVTAQQILDAGGIPVTTSAPASSALGPQYWQFDGTDDRLQLSNFVIQPQDDFAIIAAIKPTLVDSTARRVFSSSGTTSVVELYVGSNTGYPILRVKDDAAVDTFTSGVTSLLGVKSIVSARKTGNSKTIRVNGVYVSENTTETGSGTNTLAHIGTTSTGFGAFQGEKYLLILVKGAITDAELLTLEKFAASLQGKTIYNGESTLNLDFTNDSYAVWEGEYTWL